jgi:hypothetical protein
LVLAKTYWVWTTGPWDLPNPGKAKSPILVDGSKPTMNPPVTVGTEIIISKNIFDPERGAGFTREAEANSQAFQRIRSMVLLGTAILGNNRFAICRMERLLLPPRNLASRLRRCASSSAIRSKGLGCQKFPKKSCFRQGFHGGGSVGLFS